MWHNGRGLRAKVLGATTLAGLLGLSLAGIGPASAQSSAATPLALENGWSPAPGTDRPAYSVAGNVVHLNGGLNGGQVRQTIATLPAGLRPAADEWYSVVTAANVVAPLVVHPNGDIVLNAGDPRFLSLSGIHVLIGSPPPVNLALQNGWHRAWGTNGPGQTTSAGETALRGGLNGGTTRQTVTTLPSGSRPGADQWFTAVTANNVVAPVVVHATGDLVLNAGNPGFLSLEGIRVTDARPVGPPFVVNHADTYQVAQETGTGSINNTASRWDVYGSDLGNMFTYQGHTYLAFGDTFGGPAADPFFSVPHADWRSNTMAYDNSTAPPTGGIPFSGMITDAPGHAKELLSSLKQPGVEQTVIPTYGVAVGNRMYLYYMSVRSYGAPGHWTLNYSGIAYSDNGGQTWVKDMAATWPGDSNFGQVAVVHHTEGGVPYLYVYGIPGGRYGSLHLARVPEAQVLNTAAYQYWTGSSWVTGNPQAATSIVPAPVGELSVQWNSYYQKWLMMYLVDSTGQVVLRMADAPTGPWGPAQEVVSGAQYPQLYAPYLTPMWENGPDLWFTMSLYGPYHVVLMHTSLLPAATGAKPTLAAPATPGATTPRATYPFAHGRGSRPARPH